VGAIAACAGSGGGAWVLAPDSFAAQLLGLGGAGAGAGDCDEEWALEPA